MTVTVLSGTSGALYYSPAGTSGTFGESNVDVAANEITIAQYLGFRVGDPVVFSVVNTAGGAATGTLPAGITAATTYYVIGYTASTGVLQVSATLGGSTITITDDGIAVGANKFQVNYATPVAVGKVREWSFEISREEIETTSIGQAPGQYAPFKTYIAGFADGEGTAMVYVTDDDTSIANRMVEDVIARNQTGAVFKLYTDHQISSGTVNDTLSRYIQMDAVLTSASLNINPDDAQEVEIAFRPNGNLTFDLSKTA